MYDQIKKGKECHVWPNQVLHLIDFNWWLIKINSKTWAHVLVNCSQLLIDYSNCLVVSSVPRSNNK